MTKSLKLFLLGGLMLLCGVIASPLYAQSRTVSGVVVDDFDEPLFGAFVVEKGTTNGTSTDFDGKFELVVASDASVLEFQFIGFTTQEIPVGKQTQFMVKMTTDANMMEEVVVTAFATQKKVNVTGASEATTSSNLPSKSVDVPFVVPFSTTNAPNSGSSKSSTTTPLTVLLCA